MNRHRMALFVALPILVVTTADPVAALESDDFNRNNLNTDRWELVNPLGDGSVRMTGVGTQDAHLELAVPAGPSHDPWHVNRAVRVMQTTGDQDFEIETRFTSEPAVRFQLQGLVVEQDESHWIRFDSFQHFFPVRILFVTKFDQIRSKITVQLKLPENSWQVVFVIAHTYRRYGPDSPHGIQ